MKTSPGGSFLSLIVRAGAVAFALPGPCRSPETQRLPGPLRPASAGTGRPPRMRPLCPTPRLPWRSGGGARAGALRAAAPAAEGNRGPRPRPPPSPQGRGPRRSPGPRGCRDAGGAGTLQAAPAGGKAVGLCRPSCLSCGAAVLPPPGPALSVRPGSGGRRQTAAVRGRGGLGKPQEVPWCRMSCYNPSRPWLSAARWLLRNPL